MLFAAAQICIHCFCIYKLFKNISCNACLSRCRKGTKQINQFFFLRNWKSSMVASNNWTNFSASFQANYPHRQLIRTVIIDWLDRQLNNSNLTLRNLFIVKLGLYLFKKKTGGFMLGWSAVVFKTLNIFFSSLQLKIIFRVMRLHKKITLPVMWMFYITLMYRF